MWSLDLGNWEWKLRLFQNVMRRHEEAKLAFIKNLEHLVELTCQFRNEREKDNNTARLRQIYQEYFSIVRLIEKRLYQIIDTDEDKIMKRYFYQVLDTEVASSELYQESGQFIKSIDDSKFDYAIGHLRGLAKYLQNSSHDPARLPR
jgi:hypothetical protein